MKLRILPSALADLADGRRFYSLQDQVAGDYFFDSLFADIDSLLLDAGVHRKIFGYHRHLAKRFPYAIYCKVEGDTAIIWRVLDCRQNPAKNRQALE
jgi:plasmid stabilization system protein ParE